MTYLLAPSSTLHPDTSPAGEEGSWLRETRGGGGAEEEDTMGQRRTGAEEETAGWERTRGAEGAEEKNGRRRRRRTLRTAQEDRCGGRDSCKH